jgi:hypothetical protein
MDRAARLALRARTIIRFRLTYPTAGTPSSGFLRRELDGPRAVYYFDLDLSARFDCGGSGFFRGFAQAPDAPDAQGFFVG